MSDRHMATHHGMGDGMRPRAKPHDNVRRVAEQLQRYPDESEDNQDQGKSYLTVCGGKSRISTVIFMNKIADNTQWM